MKFEDLIADPLKGVKKVFEFLSLDINKIDDLVLEPKNQAEYVRSHFLNKALVIIRNNRLLNYIKSLSPVAIKKALKGYAFSNGVKQDGNNTNMLSPDVKDQINNTYFKKDKELLEKHYGIWRSE